MAMAVGDLQGKVAASVGRTSAISRVSEFDGLEDMLVIFDRLKAERRLPQLQSQGTQQPDEDSTRLCCS